jgi:hypothetical protein
MPRGGMGVSGAAKGLKRKSEPSLKGKAKATTKDTALSDEERVASEQFASLISSYLKGPDVCRAHRAPRPEACYSCQDEAERSRHQ